MSTPTVTTTITKVLNDTHVYFYSGRQCFSNWHRTPNQIKDPLTQQVYESSEQFFMALKARFFGDHETAGLIVAQPDCRKVKELGRQIRGYNEAAWDCVREGMMAWACLCKFTQNEAFKTELLATEKRILVEASPVDRVWGIGRSVEDAVAGAAWDGRNLLGEALMTVRSMLA